MDMFLVRIEAGRYRTSDGRFSVIGLCRTSSGRDGSRINHWLIKDTSSDRIVDSCPDLRMVKVSINSRYR